MTALREPRPEAHDDLDLADVAVQLRALRTASQRRRYRGLPPPLPSREVVIDAVDIRDPEDRWRWDDRERRAAEPRKR